MSVISALSRIVHIAWIRFSVIVPISRHWAVLICVIDHFLVYLSSPTREWSLPIMVLIYSSRARACLSCVLYIMVLIKVHVCVSFMCIIYHGANLQYTCACVSVMCIIYHGANLQYTCACVSVMCIIYHGANLQCICVCLSVMCIAYHGANLQYTCACDCTGWLGVKHQVTYYVCAYYVCV